MPEWQTFHAISVVSGEYNLWLGNPEMRHAPRNLRLACDHKGFTHFGGIYFFFREFLRMLQLRNFLSQHLTYLRRNHRYSLSPMILALVYPIVLGLDRLETASFLRSNGTFPYLPAGRVSPTHKPCVVSYSKFLTGSGSKCTARATNRLQNFIHLPEH